MNHLLMVELLDSNGNLDRVASMMVVNDLERAQALKEFTESYYDDRGYAVLVKIYNEEQLLEALNRR